MIILDILAVLAVLAAISAMRSRHVTLLIKIQLVLTASIFVVFAVGAEIAMWLHSMSFANPMRHSWEPRLVSLGGIIFVGLSVIWLLFTAFHAAFLIRRLLLRWWPPKTKD